MTSPPREVAIFALGHQGDGETADGLYVPYTVPGDRVRAEFEAGALGHRSFLGELSDSRRSAAFR